MIDEKTENALKEFVRLTKEIDELDKKKEDLRDKQVECYKILLELQ